MKNVERHRWPCAGLEAKLNVFNTKSGAQRSARPTPVAKLTVFNPGAICDLLLYRKLARVAAMSEFVAYVNHGASLITPRIVEQVLRQLPLWKVEFTQITAPKFPHLIDQLEFLANAVEDFAEGAYKDMPYVAIAQAVFALTYAHKKMDVIPGVLPALERADDSSVVRAVLIQNEKAWSKYAASQGADWAQVTSQP